MYDHMSDDVVGNPRQTQSRGSEMLTPWTAHCGPGRNTLRIQVGNDMNMNILL